MDAPCTPRQIQLQHNAQQSFSTQRRSSQVAFLSVPEDAAFGAAVEVLQGGEALHRYDRTRKPSKLIHKTSGLATKQKHYSGDNVERSHGSADMSCSRTSNLMVSGRAQSLAHASTSAEQTEHSASHPFAVPEPLRAAGLSRTYTGELECTSKASFSTSQRRSSQRATPADDLTPGDRQSNQVTRRKSSSRLQSDPRILRDQPAIENIPTSDLTPLGVIGEGAYAAVEKCMYTPQKRMVAVKRLREGIAAEKPGAVRGLVKENLLLRKLKHKYIVEYVGFGFWDDDADDASLFMVEECVDGGSLKNWVAKSMRGKRLYKLRDGVRWLMQMAQALQYLHECLPMVIHRDLKLDNILLQGKDPSTANIKLADFGLSALVEQDAPLQSWFGRALSGIDASSSSNANEEECRQLERSETSMARGWTENAKRRIFREDDAVSVSRKSRSGVGLSTSGLSMKEASLKVRSQGDCLTGRLGTLMYMAPEVYTKKPYTEKADVYSYGIMAYEILHYYMLIAATNGSYAECEAYVRHAVTSGYRPPLDNRLPEALTKLIERCWAHDPDKRPSMAEVAQELDTALSSLPTDTPKKQLQVEEDVKVDEQSCGCVIC